MQAIKSSYKENLYSPSTENQDWWSIKLFPSLIIAISGNNDPKVRSSNKYFINPIKINEV